MIIKTKGIVLNQRNIGDNDKVITILSKDYGIIEAIANGLKQKNSRLSASTQPLCYAEFCIFKGKKYNSINSAEIENLFYDLRLDVVKLSLAVYLCDLTASISLNNDNSWVYLRLLLNTLSLLEKNKKDERLLKSIFELKILSLAGFMPDLVCCNKCGIYEDKLMYFLPVESKLICSNCIEMIPNTIISIPTPLPVVSAMRHIIYSEDDKIFNFNVKGKTLYQLNIVTEYFVLSHIERTFKSLDMYKKMYTQLNNDYNT